MNSQKTDYEWIIYDVIYMNNYSLESDDYSI